MLLLLFSDALAWRTDIIGDTLGHEEARAIAVDSSGNVIAAGYTVNAGSGDDFTVVKLSAVDGSELWRRVINNPAAVGSDQAFGVAVDLTGDVVAVGTLGRTSLDRDFFVVKLSGTDGTELWRQSINGSDNRDDMALAVAIDSAGHVLVGGLITNTGTDADFAVLKFDGVSGTELWRRTINGSESFSADAVFALKVDSAGDVVAAGRMQNTGTGFDFTVAKFSGTDGTEWWRRIINGTTDDRDEAVTLAVDGDRNVVVAGNLVNDTGFTELAVIKLAGIDGAEIWRQTVVGITASPEIPFLPVVASAVAVDATGDVFASGGSDLGAPVLKLASANGAVLWGKFINADNSNALVVDAAGNVISAGGNGDFDVIKLSGVDGSEIWRRSIDGTASNTFDIASAVALTPTGDVVAAGTIYNSASARDLTVVRLSGTDGTVNLQTLTVNNSGAGSVTSIPGGINCGADCQEPYAIGTTVTLSAVPAAGAIFVGWSGACSGTGPCTIVMNTPTTITANFFVDTQPPTAPSSLTATAVSGSQINLVWGPASDNVGIAAYPVFRGGIFLATVTAPALVFSDTGLSASTLYSYTVAACDAAGNCSAQSGPASATTLAAGQYAYTPILELGFNLISNALTTTLDVTATFGNQDAPVGQEGAVTANVVSIWKWNAVEGRWAFYSPALTAAGIASYAASQNYEVLSVINPGEGYWVNVIVPMTLPAQSGTGFNWNGFNFPALPSGFNLITTADAFTPSQFNLQVSETPPSPGVIPTDNFVSLWAWDALAGTWYFYSPLLEASGGLPAVKAYADSRFFRHFQDYGKVLGLGTGFWVNRP